MGLLDYHPQVSIQPATGTNMCVSCYAQSWEDSRGVATPIYHLHIGTTTVPMCERCISEIVKAAVAAGLYTSPKD